MGGQEDFMLLLRMTTSSLDNGVDKLWSIGIYRQQITI